jgi:electron-transferring-flavoprotein dehydrogenase
VTKGGVQSIPRLVFPGGALIGCAAGGLVNLPRIKGNHNAMFSGIAAAGAAARALGAGRQRDELTDYEADLRSGPVAKDLRRVRNVAPLGARFGPYWGNLVLGGFDMWCQTLLGFSFLGTLAHPKSDAESTGRAARHPKIDYPRPDGVLSFDRLTNVAFSFTNHEESQPAHLRLKDAAVPIRWNLPKYAEPAARYCPAGVYEVVGEGAAARFQINFQNCVHCKTCDIKDPSQNITWVTPQGGDGPNYPNM